MLTSMSCEVDVTVESSIGWHRAVTYLLDLCGRIYCKQNLVVLLLTGKDAKRSLTFGSREVLHKTRGIDHTLPQTSARLHRFPSHSQRVNSHQPFQIAGQSPQTPSRRSLPTRHHTQREVLAVVPGKILRIALWRGTNGEQMRCH